MYQQIDLATGEPIGSPGSLPDVLVGSLTLELLADLSWTDAALGFHGTGFVAVEPPAPPAARWIHKAMFLLRIAAGKRIAIRTAAKTDPIIEDFLDVLSNSELVDLDGEATTLGVAYLVAQSLLTPEEAASLLQ